MAWTNPCRRYDERTRTCWGYTFQLSDLHLTSKAADLLKSSYDRLGEQALERLDSICPPSRRGSACNTRRNSTMQDGKQKSNKDSKGRTEKNVIDNPRNLYQLLRDHSASDEVLSTLWTEVNIKPEWVDWAQISRGQEVFYRYGGPALTGLAFQSLLGGMV